MKINPKFGIDQLVFGMKQNDVTGICGAPDKKFKDDDGNIIYTYNAQQLRLTFYEDEDFRLGYIIGSSPELTLFDKKVIGKKAADVKSGLDQKLFKSWEQEDFDLAENHFNEDNWLILQSEFDAITKVEIGAIINDKDEFDWKFKSR
ncbi:MAG TPA: hypothetical protein VK623_05795 [Flavobacterium sp.]|nr:hypothetical protein [Flavobacterium sp.]